MDDELIACLNDEFRTTLGMGVTTSGKVVMSPGIAALGKYAVAEILLKIAAYDFAAEGNPSEWRRLAVMDTAWGRVAWRIYCYQDETRRIETRGERRDYRVLEVGLAEEVCG